MIAAVVLAAGESSRLGRPKQLLPRRGRSLLRHAVDCATVAGCEPVVVVLGAGAEEMRGALSGAGARPVVNADWRSGLGSSVRAGVAALASSAAGVRAVLLLACDQPRLEPVVLRRLVAAFDRGARIAACGYAGTVGVPALFDRALFDELLALDGREGARSVLRAHAAEVTAVPWPEGAVDVDTPEDLERL